MPIGSVSSSLSHLLSRLHLLRDERCPDLLLRASFFVRLGYGQLLLVFLPKLWSLLLLTLLFLFACFLCVFFFLLCSAGLSIQPEHRSTHSVVTDLQKLISVCI